MNRYFYRTEIDEDGVERKFSVAYDYDFASGSVHYGASVFRKDRPTESYLKFAHKHTAEQRLIKCPVTIKVEPGTKFNLVEKIIRNAIRSYGVRGKRV